jgi:hypothetical protein
MKILIAIALAVCLIGFFYWVQIKNAAKKEASKIVINEPIDGRKTDDSWRDIKFKVAKAELVKNYNRLFLEQDVNGQPLRLVVDIPADLIPGLTSNFDVVKGAFRERAIHFHPDNDPTSFAAFLRSRYGIAEPIAPMPPDVAWDAISLQGDPRQLQNQLVKIKMFATAVQGDKEDPEAQLFLNIDLPNQVAVLSEKDPEYRRNVFMVFTGR